MLTSVVPGNIMYPKTAAFLAGALTLTLTEVHMVTATPFPQPQPQPQQKHIGTVDSSSAAASSQVESVSNQGRRDAVKQAFQISWDGYYKYAFPHDSLKPVSNSWEDDR